MFLKEYRLFAFSDTHGGHRKLQVPAEARIVICAGDAVEDNLKGDEYDDFIVWFGALPAKWKLFVPGNHELFFELDQADAIVRKFEKTGITVLQDAVMDCGDVTSVPSLPTPRLPTGIYLTTSIFWLPIVRRTASWTKISVPRIFCTSS